MDSDPCYLNLVNNVELLRASSWLELAKLHYNQPHTGVSLPWEVVRRVPINSVKQENTAAAATSKTVWPGMTMDGK